MSQIVPLRSSFSESLVVGRFNADRRDDVAVASFDGIRVLLATADGRFDVTASRSTQIRAVSLLTGEFNGDGRTDLVAAGYDGRVSVLTGDGLGNFAPGPGMSFRSPYVQAVADLHSDGRSDVVLTTYDPDGAHLHLLLGDGAGALADSGAFPVAGNGFPTAVIQDLDGDGRPDVLLGGPAGAGVLQLLPGDGSGGLRPAVAAENLIGPVAAMALADFNEDERADVAVMANGIGSVLFGDGRGHFTEPKAKVRLAGSGFSSRQGLSVADFNGDDRADLVLSGNDNGDAFVYLGNGRGRFRLAEGTPEYGGIYPPAPVVVGDVDGDQRPDLLGLRGGGAPALRVLRNTGGRTPRRVRAQTITMIKPRPAEVVRGQGVLLSARLRCHPGQMALFRRPLRHAAGPWRRIETASTDYRGVAEVSDQPRVSSEYQWRPTGRGKGRIRPTRRVKVRVTGPAGTAR